MDGFLHFVKSTVTAVSDEIKQQAALLSDERGPAGLTHVTKRLIAMGFPYDGESQRVGGATIATPVSPQQAASGLSVKQLGAYLHKTYPDRFMVYNLSEKTYDYSLLDQQVIEFKFPGYPAAPLNQVFALCNSIQTWLSADEGNVALLHCQTGRGRTLCALAWYLAWSGAMPSVQAALLHVTGRMRIGPEVIIPTQARYLDYLASMMAGRKPSAASIKLERVIMNGIPLLGERMPVSASASADAATSSPNAAGAAVGEEACRPYLQIFKDGHLLFTSTGRDSTDLRWYTSRDSCVLFPVDLELEGDILVRVRHLSADKKRVSMLRFGFHTGFIAPVPGNTRFLKAQLDGANNDKRFPKDFWIDMIFSPVAVSEEEALNPTTEEGLARKARQETQEQYWEQVMSARKQNVAKNAAKATAAAETTARAASATSPDASSAAAAAAAAPSVPMPTAAPVVSSSSSASPAPATPVKSKPSFGSFFSSASTKLGSLWGSDASASSGDAALKMDLSDPAVAKLHAADQEALRKAKRRMATDAAVQAALSSPHARGLSASAAARSPAAPAPVGSDPDSFADLQAYVSGLGALDASGQLDVDSDTEEERNHSHQIERQDEEELDKAMKHFNDDFSGPGDHSPALPASPVLSSSSVTAAVAASPPSLTLASAVTPSSLPPAVAAPAVAPAIPTPAPVVAVSAAAPVPTPAAVVATPAAAPAASAPSHARSDSALLEDELALLNADDIDLGADGDEEVLLDDADEAALLASLQDELGGQ